MRQIVCFSLVILLLALAPPVQAADFAVTAVVDQNSLNADFYKTAGRFYADVTVKNISSSSQTITVWTNPSWSWVTDSQDVVTSQEALKNFPSNLTLKPGQIYESRLEMAAAPSTKKPTDFRLGFSSNATLPVQESTAPNLVWTSPLTLAR